MSVSTFQAIVSFSRLRGEPDEDAADRLNHLYTIVVLILFAFLATGAMLVGSPMDCWTPPEFPYTYEQYVKSYCWVKNTYYIAMDQAIPADAVKRQSEELSYYQWVPFILLLMAFFFKLPNAVWRLFNQASGIDLARVSDMTSSLLTLSTEDKQVGVQRIAGQVHCWLKAHRLYPWSALARFKQRLSRVLCIFGVKRDSSYLTFLYLFVKLLYLLNILCQFALLNAFMGDWYMGYGVSALRKLVTAGVWMESPRFPKVTLCDFDVRQLQNIQRYTVQCALPVNIYNEKIFFFLWFWLALVGLVTGGSLVLWLWRVLYKPNHLNYVRKYLVIQDKFKNKDQALLNKFVRDYLRDDGVFLLRLVAQNSNIIVASEVIGELWEQHKKRAEKEESADSSSSRAADSSSSAADSFSAAEVSGPVSEAQETDRLIQH